MATKESDKISELPAIESMVSNILAINQARLAPYIELFHYTPENIALSSLGEMLGFFQISDISEDSAYIVNFLTSVIKKEYYANPKRSISASLDSALHRVNLALAETAKHGNVQWVGKINAAICVLEKNNLHFSVAGNARILLIRRQSIIDISEDFSSNKDPNPLKTFVDVSSGRLEANDKVIVSSEELFNLFSLTELKKASYRFAPEKFTQFLRTALINETELAGTFIIDLMERKAESPAKSAAKKSRQSSLNAFSGKAFQPSAVQQFPEKKSPPQEDLENYTDKKTGHIYIREQQISPEQSSMNSHYALFAKEKISDLSYWTKKQARRSFLKIKSGLLSLRKHAASLKKERSLSKEKAAKIASLAEKAEEAVQDTPEKIVEPAPPIHAEPVAENKKLAEEGQKASPPQPFFEKLRPIILSGKNFSLIAYRRFQTIATTAVKFSKEKISTFPFRKLIPDFSKIKRLFHMFSYRQKIYAALIVALIIFGPLIYLKIKKGRDLAIEQARKESIAALQENLAAAEKKARESDQFSEIGAISDGKYVFLAKEGLAILGNKNIFTSEKEGLKSNAIPENIGAITTASYMKDLNLVLLITQQNKVFSFSPVTHAFIENAIAISSEAKIVSAGTYLTYLYLVDGAKNQIYRYPRAEGGFGAKADWLKDSADFSSVISSSLDENIYLATNSSLTKFFKGKKDPFELGKIEPPLAIKNIYASIDTQSIYVLDAEHARIAVFQKDGTFLQNYANEILSQATSLVADEANKKLYAITQEKIISFEMK